MRIEILVGAENPVFYPLNKPKLVIGSDLTCDIVISEDQISRKHLIIVQEGDRYSVIDQGSTNGSYLNEERLIPGRRTEFTSYFPVRLGSSVLISLVSDDEAADEVGKISIPFEPESIAAKKSPHPPGSRSFSDKTSVLSLKELNASSTEKLVRKRQNIKKNASSGKSKEGSAAGKKKVTKKKKKKLQPIHLVVMAILAPAIYFTFNEQEEVRKSEDALSPQGKIQSARTQVQNLNSKAKLPVAPSILTIIKILESSEKCTTEEEKILCEGIKGLEERPWGVVTKDDQLIVMLDAAVYFDAIEATLPPPVAESSGQQEPADATDVQPELSPKQQEKYFKELWELAVGKFMLDGFNNDDYLKLKGKTLVFAFFLLQEGFPSLKATLAIRPESLQIVRTLVSSGRFNYIETSRAEIMNFRGSYYELNL